VEGGGVAPDRVYLDYAGFSPVDPRVLNVMRPFLEAGIGNPSAPHSLGFEARESLEAARAKVARLVGGGAPGVIFTSGATEANNLAIRGVAQRGGDKARHLVTSAVEHISVLNACRDFEKAGGAVSLLPVDAVGCIDPEALRKLLRPETVLVSIGAACGEIGTVQPLGDIARITRAAGVPLHVDAVGALGRVPFGGEAVGLDLVTVSSNDLYGPPGAGALWVRQGIKLLPQMLGGGQEGGYRSGTENLPALVGFGVAAELMRAEAGHGEPARLAALRKRLVDGLAVSIPECRLTGSSTARLPHHASFVLRGVKADGVLLDLDLCGVAASSGSACAQRTGTPSHVLRAIGCTPEEMEGSLCFTLGRWTTLAEVDAVLDRLPSIVARLRALALPDPR
jgi:cysteine desulfurase